MDEEDNEIETEKDGELWMRGPNICCGYLNNEEATRNSITNDGWLKSGDIGHVTPEGYGLTLTIVDHRMFFITDRVKELIKFKGPIHRNDTDDRFPSSTSVIGRVTGLSSKSERRRSCRSLLQLYSLRSPKGICRSQLKTIPLSRVRTHEIRS